MTQTDPKNVSPDQLVRGFNKSPILKCIVFALVFHVVLIGATSVATVLEWTGVKAAESADQPDKPDLARTPPKSSPAASQPATTGPGPRKEAPVLRELSETRPAPRNPDDGPGGDIPYDLTR